MAISTGGFILAGSVDPRVQLVRTPLAYDAAGRITALSAPCTLLPVAPYPTFGVVMSCSLVLVEAMMLWQLLTRPKVSMVFRALAGCLAAGLFVVEIQPVELI
jgi:hypothetical protein